MEIKFKILFEEVEVTARRKLETLRSIGQAGLMWLIKEGVAFAPSPFQADDSKYVTIESYEQSKPVIKTDKNYDATMRAVFVVTRDEGKVEVQFLGSYWKLPPKPLSTDLSRDSSISSFHCKSYDELAARSAIVSDEDQEIVYTQLRNILPKVFERVWRLTADKLLEGASGKERLYQLCRIANHYGLHGKFALAHYYCQQAIDYMPDSHLGYHNQGQIYTMENRYEEAIASYDEAIKRENNSYRRQGEAYYLKGDRENAERCFIESREPPSKFRRFKELADSPLQLRSFRYSPISAATGQAEHEEKIACDERSVSTSTATLFEAPSPTDERLPEETHAHTSSGAAAS